VSRGKDFRIRDGSGGSLLLDKDKLLKAANEIGLCLGGGAFHMSDISKLRGRCWASWLQHARIYSEIAKRSNAMFPSSGCLIPTTFVARIDGEGRRRALRERGGVGELCGRRQRGHAHGDALQGRESVPGAAASTCWWKKPITDSLSEAEQLVRARAKETSVCSRSGHVERFNPVMRTLNRSAGRGAFIEVHASRRTRVARRISASCSI